MFVKPCTGRVVNLTNHPWSFIPMKLEIINIRP
jgi:hypothetical protein